MKTTIFVAFIALVCAVLFLTGNASAEFATDEVGISAYVNVGTIIDLDQAASAYKIIEDRTSTYVIGVVEVPNATDYELPHVYTSSDGWIMAYYAKETPRALIIPWGQFDRNNPDLSKLNNTRLEEAISKVSNAIGVSYPTIKSNTKYFDFQYPDANGLTLIAESRAIDGVDSFRFRIPSEFTLYNASWEYYSYGSNTNGSDGKPNSVFKLDGYVLTGTDGSFDHNSSSEGGHSRDERYFGTINGLTTGSLHEGYLSYYYLWLHAWSDEGSSNIAIALVYKQP